MSRTCELTAKAVMTGNTSPAAPSIAGAPASTPAIAALARLALPAESGITAALDTVNRVLPLIVMCWLAGVVLLLAITVKDIGLQFPLPPYVPGTFVVLFRGSL